MSTRLKYDGLPEGMHTFTFDEKADKDGNPVVVGQPRINPGDVVEVEDLNHPTSERARICRGHVDRGIAHVVDGENGTAPAKRTKAKS